MVLAEHKNSKSRVAIKIISKALIKDIYRNLSEPFQEVSLLEDLAQINCENILEFLDMDENDDYVYLVTKVYAGRCLQSYLNEQTNFFQYETRAKKVVRDVAVGLACLHKRNIVHRDIKMGNILMSDSNAAATAYLADFGLAHKLKSQTDTVQW